MTQTAIKLADGVEVRVADTCFDYYGMKSGRFVAPLDEQGWGWFEHDDGTRDLLDGDRVCSLAHARKMGWLEKQPDDVVHTVQGAKRRDDAERLGLSTGD